MRYILLIALAVVILSGCQIQQNLSTNGEEMKTLDSTTKQGDTTLTGKVVKSGETFSILAGDGTQTEIDSYKVDLNEFADQEVSITGQYSGDTLFVSDVK